MACMSVAVYRCMYGANLFFMDVCTSEMIFCTARLTSSLLLSGMLRSRDDLRKDCKESHSTGPFIGIMGGRRS